MNIKTVSFLKAHASDLPVEQPLHITQDGKEVYVIQGAGEYREQQETITLLKLINLSERSLVTDGKLMTSRTIATYSTETNTNLIKYKHEPTALQHSSTLKPLNQYFILLRF